MRKLKDILEEVEIESSDEKESEKDSVEEDAPANVVSGIAGLTEPIHPKSVISFKKRKKDKNNS